MTCSISECDDPVVARTWCRKHYTRWYKTGSLQLQGKRRAAYAADDYLTEQLATRDRSNCWDDWPFGMSSDGYAIMTRDRGHGERRSERVHRVAVLWDRDEEIHGKIGSHLCHNRACFNPDHIRMGTQRENMGLTRQEKSCPQVGQFSCLALRFWPSMSLFSEWFPKTKGWSAERTPVVPVPKPSEF